LIQHVGSIDLSILEEFVETVVFNFPVGTLIAGGFVGEEIDWIRWIVVERCGYVLCFVGGETAVVVGGWRGEGCSGGRCEEEE
jgi:hypothetical protein